MVRPLIKQNLGLPRDLQNNKLSATHFLCLPLCHSTSRAQLENIVQTLKTDGGLRKVPRKAFRQPRSFHIQMGSFRIETAAELGNTIELLHGLDLSAIMKLPAADRRLSPAPSSTSNVATPALRLTLKGLTCGAQDPSRAKWIKTMAEDPSRRLLPFVRTIRDHLKYAPRPLGYRDVKYQHQSDPAGPLVISMQETRKMRKFVDAAGHETKAKVAMRLDARDLLEKYDNFEWAKDIQLEKLSLCREGRIATFHGPNNEMLIDEYYEEIASIPLPQDSDV